MIQIIKTKSLRLSGDILEVHELQFFNHLFERRSIRRSSRPTPLHQTGKGLGSSSRDIGSQVSLDHASTDLSPSNVSIRRLSGGDFPKDDSIGEDICFFGVVIRLDDFGCHPLKSSDFPGHLFSLQTSPTEIADLRSVAFVYKDVQALEISVDDGGGERMEEIHSPCDFKSQAFSILPIEFYPSRLKKEPKRFVFAIFEHDCKSRIFRAGSKEHDDV